MVYPEDDNIIVDSLTARFIALECRYKRFCNAGQDTNANTVAESCYNIARILKDRYNVEMVESSGSLRTYIRHRFVEDSSLESACDDALFYPEFD